MDIRVTLDEFKSLPQQEQFDIVFTIGDFVEAKTEGKFQTILYAVDDFFVELSFDPRVNKIVKVSGVNLEDIRCKYSENFKGNNPK